MMAQTRGIVLFAHGARDSSWSDTLHHLQRITIEKAPDHEVCLAFLELQDPSLPDAVTALIQKGIRHLTIAPIFWAQGRHIRYDLPKLLAELGQQYPDVAFSTTPVISELPNILEMIASEIVKS